MLDPHERHLADGTRLGPDHRQQDDGHAHDVDRVGGAGALDLTDLVASALAGARHVLSLDRHGPSLPQAAPGSGAELHGNFLTKSSTTVVLSPPQSWRWPIWLEILPVLWSTSAAQCERAYFLPAGKAP